MRRRIKLSAHDKLEISRKIESLLKDNVCWSDIERQFRLSRSYLQRLYSTYIEEKEKCQKKN